jgi:biopolymer transport protein ExbB
LITTAAGLLVGIPALALYHYFRGRIERFVFEMEEVSLQLVEELNYESMRTRRAERGKDSGTQTTTARPA